jgi:hypothetical protein
MKQPIDVSLHVTNVLADGETINTNNNTFTRQQDRVSGAKSSQQDGRQFMGSGQNIYLPTTSPCESSPKPSLGNCVEDISLVV